MKLRRFLGFHSVSIFVVALAIGTHCERANAAVVAEWNFNDLVASTGAGAAQTPPSNQGQTAYSPSTGSGSLNLVGWTVDNVGAEWGITNFAGTTTNALGLTPAGQALALQGGVAAPTVVNNGATLLLQFNLLNYIDPILSFAAQRTATGFGSSTAPNAVSYSTDNTTYTPFATFAPVSSFANPNGLHTFDFSSVAALDHATTAFIKLTFNGATNVAGNDRLDNIQLNATPAPIPLPSAVLVFLGVAAAAGAARRRILGLMA